MKKGIIFSYSVIQLFSYSVIVILLLSSCESPNCNEKGEENGNRISNVNIEEFEILCLPYEEWPGKMLNLSNPLNPPFPTDSAGISLFVWKDNSYYHPVILATMADWFLDSYYQTDDTLYLNWTKKYLNKLDEISYKDENAKFFPYPFNYNIHGKESELLEAPWYSGMAQGIALGAYSLFYKNTNDPYYLDESYKIFNSYSSVAFQNKPWISLIDHANYLWFEEYPQETEPNHTLNGFFYSIFGLYQFYQVTKNEYAKYLLQASITTIKHYITRFRVENGISYYCLGHKHQAANYHKLHTAQLNSLYRITGDKYFSAMAELFYHDYH